MKENLTQYLGLAAKISVVTQSTQRQAYKTHVPSLHLSVLSRKRPNLKTGLKEPSLTIKARSAWGPNCLGGVGWAGTLGLVGEVLQECRVSEPKSLPPAMFLGCS